MNIPLMDLKRQNQQIQEEVYSAMKSIVDNCQFIGGEIKKDFEDQFAKACGVKHCIGVGNGTDSLVVAFKALGVGPGDEVLMPVNTFIATAEGASLVGGRAIFADINASDYHWDLNKVEDQLKSNKKIKVIVPVHLYGRLCDMPAVMTLAEKYGVRVVEDCAQAHLASIDGTKAGAFGDIGSFSFYPGKNLGAFGDAGAVVSNSDDLANFMRKYANHGRQDKYLHEMEGMNSRLDTLHAAVLKIKLQHLQNWSDKRYERAQRMNQILGGLDDKIVLPEIPAASSHVFHLYVIRSKRRDELQSFLKEKGVATGIHYPISLHNQPAYKDRGYKPEDYPVANELQSEILSLPLFAEMTDDEQDYIADSVKEFLS